MTLKRIVSIVACLAIGLVLMGCQTREQILADYAKADYGPKPEHYEETIKQTILPGLKDPDSAKFEFERMTQGRIRNGFNKYIYCWVVKTWVNAKNSYGGYTGKQPYWFYFRDGKIEHLTRPWEVPEAEWTLY